MGGSQPWCRRVLTPLYVQVRSLACSVVCAVVAQIGTGAEHSTRVGSSKVWKLVDRGGVTSLEAEGSETAVAGTNRSRERQRINPDRALRRRGTAQPVGDKTARLPALSA